MNAQTQRNLGRAHELIANITLGLIFVHVAGGLMASFMHHENWHERWSLDASGLIDMNSGSESSVRRIPSGTLQAVPSSAATTLAKGFAAPF